jgi:transcriptional repressor NF-X1
VPHVCHEGVVVAGADTADEGLGLVGEGEAGPCPPCPFLTEKVCACGKKQVGNVRCSQERVSCGSLCGKCVVLSVVGRALTSFFSFFFGF